jgi:hypothetical protein
VGYYRQCLVCTEQQRRYARRIVASGGPRKWYRCMGCGVPTAGHGWCSAPCATNYKQRLRMRYKAEVLTALGGVCTCVETECCHIGPCRQCHPDVLTVDHTNEDGGLIRRRRRDGALKRPGAGVLLWSRYRRALALPNHGMRLLCANCHLFLSRSDRERDL